MVKSGNSTIVRSAARALDVLEIVVQAEKAPTFTMIQKASGIPKSSLSYLMQELMQKRYVQYDPESKVYYPGLALLALSAECMSTTNFSVELTRGIKSLQEETGETTHAVIREGRFAIFIGKQASALNWVPMRRDAAWSCWHLFPMTNCTHSSIPLHWNSIHRTQLPIKNGSTGKSAGYGAMDTPLMIRAISSEVVVLQLPFTTGKRKSSRPSVSVSWPARQPFPTCGSFAAKSRKKHRKSACVLGIYNKTTIRSRQTRLAVRSKPPACF